jgi:hypothetical protein
MKEDVKMQLNAPKNTTWWFAVIAGVVGIVGLFTRLPAIGDNAIYFVVIAFVLLALATAVKGL